MSTFASDAEFHEFLAGAIARAKRVAAAEPASPVAGALLQYLAMIRMYADMGRLDPATAAQIAPMFAMLRTHTAGFGPRSPAVEALFAAADRICEHLGSATANSAGEGDDGSAGVEAHLPRFEGAHEFDSFAEFVDALHATLRDIEQCRRRAVAGSHAGDAAALSACDVLDVARDAVEAVRDRLAESIGTGEPPQRRRRGSTTLQIHPALRPRIDALTARADRALSTPARSPTSSVEEFLAGIRVASVDCDALRQAVPQAEALEPIADMLERTTRGLKRWVSDGEVPDADDRAGFTPADAARAVFHPTAWSRVPGLGERIDRILSAVDAGVAATDAPEFLTDLYTADIDAKVLRVLSGGDAYDDVVRELQNIVYKVADDRIKQDYARRDIDLARWVDKQLGVHRAVGADGLDAFVRRLDDLQRCWRGEPQVAPDARVDHRPRGEPAVENPGWDRSYAEHMLESAARSTAQCGFDEATRIAGLHLRWVRHRLDDGRRLDADERQTVGRMHAEAARAATRDAARPELRAAREALAAVISSDWAGPADDPPATLPAMLDDDDHHTAFVADAAADAECLLGRFPDDAAVEALLRGLLALRQAAEHKRALDAAELLAIAEGLSAFRCPVDAFSLVPDFADDFQARLRLIADYATGRRVNSPTVLFELVERTIADVAQMADGRMWDQDKPIVGAVYSQLLAIRRWTADGRLPTEREQADTAEVLAVVDDLKDPQRHAELIRRLGEIADGFAALPPGPATPARRRPVDRADFERLLDETERETDALRPGLSFDEPGPAQAYRQRVWTTLGRMRKFLDPQMKRSRRERDAMRATLLEPAVGGNPYPGIHDFLEEHADRLAALDAFFQELMEQPEFAAVETRPLDRAGIRLFVLGVSMSAAFVREANGRTTINTCRWETVHGKHEADGLEVGVAEFLPTHDEFAELVDCGDRRPTDLRWSPAGDFVAYTLEGGDGSCEIGWARVRPAPANRRTGEPALPTGEVGRTSGEAFAWNARGDALILARAADRKLWRLSLADRTARELVAFPDDGDPEHRPRLVASPDGSRLAFTCRRAADGCVELWVAGFDGATPYAKMTKRWNHAAAIVLPFWGHELAAAAIDPVRGTTEIGPARTGGEALYRSASAEPAVTPTWSDSGRWIALVKGGRLALFDCDRREVVELPSSIDADGTPHFRKESVLMEGGRGAWSMTVKNLDHRRPAAGRF